MEINKKNIKYGIDNHHHGLFVKEARLRQGYRLTEVAKEICDASYLSKIESGRLFPKVEVFEKIVKKLDIRFPAGERICPIDVFTKGLYQNDLSSIETYLEQNVWHHYEIRMLDFFRCVITDNLEKAGVLKKEIDQFEFHFNPKEEQAYLLFAGIYFLKVFEWNAGKRCLKESFYFMEMNKEEDPYLFLQLAKYYFRIQKTFVGFIWLERAISKFRRIFEQKWVFECDMLWCRESIINGDGDTVEKKIEEWKSLIDPNSNHSQWNQLFNLSAILEEKKGRYKEAEAFHLKSIEGSDKKIQEMCLIDTIKFYYHRQKKDQVIKLVEQLKVSELSIENRILIDFYYLKLTDEDSEYFENFLKKDAIPFAMEGLDYQNAALYTKELTKYYRRKSSYKKVSDAYYKLEKFYDELNLADKI